MIWARNMAQDAIDMVLGYLGKPLIPCDTAHHLLHGAEGYGPEFWRILVKEFGVLQATARHLAEKFGTASLRVVEIAKQDTRYASSIVQGLPPTQAEVVYSVREEMALTIEDVLARRIGMQLFSWAAAIEAAPVVGSILAGLLGWTPSETTRAVEEYVQKITRLMTGIGLLPEARIA